MSSGNDRIGQSHFMLSCPGLSKVIVKTAPLQNAPFRRCGMTELACRVGGHSSTMSREPTDGVEPDHTPVSAPGLQLISQGQQACKKGAGCRLRNKHIFIARSRRLHTWQAAKFVQQGAVQVPVRADVPALETRHTIGSAALRPYALAVC